MGEDLVDKVANNLIPACIGGLIVASVIGTAFKFWLGGIIAKGDKLENRVNELENKQMAKLEETLEAHIKEDRSAVTDAILGRIEKGVAQLTDRVGFFAETVSKHQAEIEANHNYVSNLDKSFQRHKEQQNAK